MARAWRPSLECHYVIGEVHGNAASLEHIFNRILPLRKFKVSQDRIVMLGDYIDGQQDGHKVIDMLMNVKSEYGDRMIALRGNHEELLIRAYNGTEVDFNSWTDKGGRATIAGYLERMRSSANPYAIPHNRIRDIIPKEHIEFLQSLPVVHIDIPFCFFHGGFNPQKPIYDSSIDTILFDDVSRYVKKCLHENTIPFYNCPDAYTYVCAHNYESKEPFVYSPCALTEGGCFVALGGSAPEKLIIMELNSGAINAISAGKSKLYPIQ